MTTPTSTDIDTVVAELRKMESALYLGCAPEIADDVCHRTDKAINLIRALAGEMTGP